MRGNMRIYYDEEEDYLTIFVGAPRPNYGEDIASGVTIFKDEDTDEIIGVGILNCSNWESYPAACCAGCRHERAHWYSA